MRLKNFFLTFECVTFDFRDAVSVISSAEVEGITLIQSAF